MPVEFQPPIYDDLGKAPAGVCSRWMGDSPCGAAGTSHVVWDSEMSNGCVCADHAEEIRQNWIYVGLHPYAAPCAAAGRAVYRVTEDRCVFPAGTRERAAEVAADLLLVQSP